MRGLRFGVAVVAMWAAGVAWAGPNAPKSQLRDLPSDVQAAFTPGEEALAQLEAQIAAARIDAELAQSSIKVDKMEARALDEQARADKAAEKAAKEAGDKAAVKDAKQAQRDTKAAADQADLDVKTAKERADLAWARVELLEAEHDLKRAELEQQKAQAIYDHEGEIDVNVYAAATAKQKARFEQARADLKLAEARLSAAGGDPSAK